jgi:hypothetical protein
LGCDAEPVIAALNASSAAGVSCTATHQLLIDQTVEPATFERFGSDTIAAGRLYAGMA